MNLGDGSIEMRNRILRVGIWGISLEIENIEMKSEFRDWKYSNKKLLLWIEMSEYKINLVSQFSRWLADSRSLSEKLGDRNEGAGSGVDGRPLKKYILYDTAWKSLRFLKISRARPRDGTSVPKS